MAVADGGYASLKLLDRCGGLSEPIVFITTRLGLDAALYGSAPPRKPGQIGRPRLKGERLPNLSEVAEDRAAVWTPITVADWYVRQQEAHRGGGLGDGGLAQYGAAARRAVALGVDPRSSSRV